MSSFDFIHAALPKSDIELFGLDNPEMIPNSDWADIAVKCGLFPSKTQARKNGWGDQLKPGFQEKVLKKKRITVTVLNWFEEQEQ